MTVTASTISFLCIFAPGRSRSRTIVVIPALYPIAAVRWTGSLGLSFGKLLTYTEIYYLGSIATSRLHTLPRCLLARFRGRNARDPWRGADHTLVLHLSSRELQSKTPTLEFTVRHGWWCWRGIDLYLGHVGLYNLYYKIVCAVLLA